MSPTDASESMLESTMVRSLINNAGYIEGDPKNYDKDHAGYARLRKESGGNALGRPLWQKEA